MSESVLTVEAAVEAVQGLLADKKPGSGRVTPDTVLTELGLDSMDAAELLLRLEEAAGVALDPSSAGEAKTVADLAKMQPAPTLI